MCNPRKLILIYSLVLFSYKQYIEHFSSWESRIMTRYFQHGIFLFYFFCDFLAVDLVKVKRRICAEYIKNVIIPGSCLLFKLHKKYNTYHSPILVRHLVKQAHYPCVVFKIQLSIHLLQMTQINKPWSLVLCFSFFSTFSWFIHPSFSPRVFSPL